MTDALGAVKKDRAITVTLADKIGLRESALITQKRVIPHSGAVKEGNLH